MPDPESFRAQLAAAVVTAPRTPNGIPLIGYNQLEIKDANAAPLISVLADIVLAACAQPLLTLPQAYAAAA
jgi:hypothetical protein